MIAGVGLITLHPVLLAAGYGLLVVDVPSDGCRWAMVTTPTPECYDELADLVNDQQVDEVLVVGQRPKRSVAIGAVPAFATLATRELLSRGVGRDQIRVINTQAMTLHQMFRELDAALRQDTASRCSVLSTATLSRHCRTVIDQSLSPQRASVYQVRAIEPQADDAWYWWRSRTGVKRIMNHGLRTIFVVHRGESRVDRVDRYRHVIRDPIKT